MMKTAVFALLLLFSLSQGEALTCYKCLGTGPRLCTPIGFDTCRDADDVCAAVVIRNGDRSRSIRSCMSPEWCQRFAYRSRDAGARCCSSNRCN